MYRCNQQLMQGVEGWLAFRLDDWSRTMRAHLLSGPGSHRELLPTLLRARILRIEGAIHIVGTEYVGRPSTKARATAYRQSWLCASTAEQAHALLQRIPVVDPEADPMDDDVTPDPELDI